MRGPLDDQSLTRTTIRRAVKTLVEASYCSAATMPDATTVPFSSICRHWGVSAVADTKATDCPLPVTPIFGKMIRYGMSREIDAAIHPLLAFRRRTIVRQGKRLLDSREHLLTD